MNLSVLCCCVSSEVSDTFVFVTLIIFAIAVTVVMIVIFAIILQDARLECKNERNNKSEDLLQTIGKYCEELDEKMKNGEKLPSKSLNVAKNEKGDRISITYKKN